MKHRSFLAFLLLLAAIASMVCACYKHYTLAPLASSLPTRTPTPSCANGGVVTTLAGSGAYGAADGPGTTASFEYPSGDTVDTAGNVYVADANTNLIRKITPGGVVTTLAGSLPGGYADGTGTAALFSNPSGVAVDPSGNVYVADYFNTVIRKITSVGVVTTLAGSAGVTGSTDGTGAAALFDYPYGVGVDSFGNVYVADTYNNLIRKITSGGVVTTLAGSAGVTGSTNATGSAASFYEPNGVVVDTFGNVYVADSGNNMIRKITSGGVVTTFAGQLTSGSVDGIGTAASFWYPEDVAVDTFGNVYVADSGNNLIRKITSGGVVTTLAGQLTSGSANGTGTAASFNFPEGLAVDSSCRVYVVDSFNNLIRKIQ